MISKLQTEYDSLERLKDEMLFYMDSLTDDERRKQPGPREWAPIQVLEHIVSVEEIVSGPYSRLPSGTNKVQVKGRIFMLAGVGVMRTGIRVPTIPLFHPTGDLDYPTIRQRWHFARQSLLLKLGEVDPSGQLPIAMHPIAGPMTAAMITELLDIHLRYHLKFLPRIVVQSVSPVTRTLHKDQLK